MPVPVENAEAVACLFDRNKPLKFTFAAAIGTDAGAPSTVAAGWTTVEGGYLVERTGEKVRAINLAHVDELWQ